MHLEKRVGLNIFSILIEDGLSKDMSDMRLNVVDANSEKKRKKLFKNLVENQINAKIIGDSRLPC